MQQITYLNEGRQDRKCFWCGVYENICPCEIHHAEKRSLHPELKEDPLNKCPLCWKCHRKTEESYQFFLKVKRLWKIHLQTKLPELSQKNS